MAGGGDISRIYVDSRRTIAPLDRNLFGSFLEHLGRAIYEGIYDPGSSLSDANGFRTDVMDQIKKLGVPIVRYPGGNFVSGYNWLDGVGPKQDRPTVLDKAWNSLESNQFGTNEFMAWCKAVGTKPLMGFNLGRERRKWRPRWWNIATWREAPKWSDLRRKHGYRIPTTWSTGAWATRWTALANRPHDRHRVRAESARRRPADAGRGSLPEADRLRIERRRSMPTYLEWDREVLEECYEHVDGLSLHRYYGNTPEETGGDRSKFWR